MADNKTRWSHILGEAEELYIYQGNCRYACFNQHAQVSLYCDTYAVLVDGCLILF
jgi:hypothetical protein